MRRGVGTGVGYERPYAVMLDRLEEGAHFERADLCGHTGLHETLDKKLLSWRDKEQLGGPISGVAIQSISNRMSKRRQHLVQNT